MRDHRKLSLSKPLGFLEEELLKKYLSMVDETELVLAALIRSVRAMN